MYLWYDTYQVPRGTRGRGGTSSTNQGNKVSKLTFVSNFSAEPVEYAVRGRPLLQSRASRDLNNLSDGMHSLCGHKSRTQTLPNQLGDPTGEVKPSARTLVPRDATRCSWQQAPTGNYPFTLRVHRNKGSSEATRRATMWSIPHSAP